MKLRADGIDQHITPFELKKLFEAFGVVEEVAIYAGDNLVYGVVTMPNEEEADLAILSAPTPKFEDQLPAPRWKGRPLKIDVANRSRGPWLSPNWRPLVPKRFH